MIRFVSAPAHAIIHVLKRTGCGIASLPSSESN
jgi:hypothetical protein